MGRRGFKSRSGQIFFQTFIQFIYIYIYIYIYRKLQETQHWTTSGENCFPQKLSSVEFPVTFCQFLLNLDCESICDPPGGDTLLAQGIYLTNYIYIYIYIYS